MMIQLFNNAQTGGFSNREIPANALEGVAQNKYEENILATYKEAIDSLNEKQMQLENINRQIKDIFFTKGSDRSQLTRLNNQKKIISEQINRKDKALLIHKI